MKDNYGITHALPMWALPLWRRIMCRRNLHVFDEVTSSCGGHYLCCDACDLIVNIESIDASWIERIV